MADTSKPDERVADEKTSTSAQSAPKENDDTQEAGRVRMSEVASRPITNNKSTDNTKDPQDLYEHLRTRVMIATLLVSTFAAIASAFSACGSWKTLETNIRRDQLDQRAWVSISHAIKPQILEAGVPMMLGVTITNSGKTPARRLTQRSIGASAPGNEKFSPSYPLKELDGLVILPPGGNMDAADLVRMPQSEIDALKNGSRIFYFFGKISYDDVFGRGYCYTYCSYLDRNLINTRHCQTYNDETDGRCEDQKNTK